MGASVVTGRSSLTTHTCLCFLSGDYLCKATLVNSVQVITQFPVILELGSPLSSSPPLLSFLPFSLSFPPLTPTSLWNAREELTLAYNYKIEGFRLLLCPGGSTLHKNMWKLYTPMF